NHAGRGFFRAANHALERVLTLGVQDADQVGAIVHGDVRLVVERGQDVAVIGVIVLALDGEHGNAVVADQAGGNVVLRRKRVGRAELDICASVTKANGQVC